VDKITRHKLKTDRFAVEVEHSVEYVSEHKKQVAMYGAIALAVVGIIAGVWYYRNQQHDQRQQELARAQETVQAPVTVVAPPAGALFYPSEAAKTAASQKAFKDLYAKHSGTQEGLIAASYLGALSVDANNMADAEKYFKIVADSGDKNHASMAKLSLSQVYLSTNRPADGEKLLRSLYENPTTYVSKEQAAIALARALAANAKQAEARKLLEPLRTERPAVSQLVITMLAQLPPQ